MLDFKDRNLKFSVLFWLFLSIPFGISYYLIMDMYQYQKYLRSSGEVGYGTYRQVDALPKTYAIFLEDGREILSVYTKKFKNLVPNKEYKLIYVSLGKIVVSVEFYPLNKFLIFRSIRSYSIGLLFLIAAAYFAALKFSKN
jgi:hypothetical protein